MRLSLTILLLILAFQIKGNASKHQLDAHVLVTKMVSQKTGNVYKVSDLKTNKSKERNEIKKGVQSTSVYIVHSISQVSFTSIASRHFLDAFFISFFSYFTSYSNYAAHNYRNQEIAINRKLMLIYPYHSFW